MPVTRTQAAPPPPPAPPSAPPTQDDLQGAITSIEGPLRQCGAAGSGELVIDAAIDGADGRVRDFGLRGPGAVSADPACIADGLGQLQFAPFPGTVEVQWGLRL